MTLMDSFNEEFKERTISDDRLTRGYGVRKPKLERYTKYEVMKLDDIEKYCSLAQRRQLIDIIMTVQDGREKDGKVRCNNYVVVNEDQPYAEQVWKLIQEQWEKANEK
jgi:hypothetical protein